ncbi:putative aspartic-type endopeptidase opsB [Tolypocladium ophioglossoides CBS 100239]|uniref:Putative aspartic-type endopeptidase opsB n=1 Tax=Tolypocladium ophioglossoides (strain CBS 100239) TaxID=1163406 RepID=A0A0L0NBK5_TOLOC|nr:putative aspartic-type endopeptidase opsB [Tolypocladium ophioglossoides CBS 100239]
MPFSIVIGLLSAALGGRVTAQSSALKVVQAELQYSKDLTLAPFVPIIEFAMADQTEKLKGIFDTGSSDIVVPQTSSPICQNEQQQCIIPTKTGFLAGAFYPKKAQGVTTLDVPLNASFVNGAGFQGGYIKTAVAVGGATVPDTQLGLFFNGSLPPETPLFPIFGVGPVQGEAAPRVYPNLVAHMKDIGAIKSNSFSVYTNDFRAGNGSVVFGGVDTTKFTGQLQETRIERSNDGALPSFVIQFSSLKMVMGGARSSVPSPCDGPPRMPAVQDLAPRNGLGFSLLDSGNPGIGIPAASIEIMAKVLRTTFSQRDGLGLVDCNLLNNRSMLTFGFNQDKIKIDMPLDTIVVPARFVKGTGCALPIFPSQDTASLGFPFLQSVYVVFDMDKERLLLAQAKLNVTESNIKEFP